MMLAISPSAQSALESYARPAFAVRVRKALAEKYPHFLPRFPQDLQDVITGNMLGRAALWGLRQQSSLLAYCEFMISVAGNFDEDTDIRAALESAPEPKDFTLRGLPRTVPPAAWARSEKLGSNLPFFIPPALVAAPVADRTVAALPIVLFGQEEAHNARAAVNAALGQAGELGLTAFADSVLVVATCRSFFGPGFTALSWMNDLRPMPPHKRLHALRLRLAIEHGRFV